jgi:hypothetical protein
LAIQGSSGGTHHSEACVHCYILVLPLLLHLHLPFHLVLIRRLSALEAHHPNLNPEMVLLFVLLACCSCSVLFFPFWFPQRQTNAGDLLARVRWADDVFVPMKDFPTPACYLVTPIN